MPEPIAILDACVLYPAPLRDLLVSLAAAGLFRARWSDRIHKEWTAAVLRRHADNPRVTAEKLALTRRLMEQALPGARVIGYQHRVDPLTLPDADDRHVLAAAIQSQARVIVTFNLADFPDATLLRHGISAQHPDIFIDHLWKADAAAVVDVCRAIRGRLKSPPLDALEYISVLGRQGLCRFAQNLRAHADSI